MLKIRFGLKLDFDIGEAHQMLSIVLNTFYDFQKDKETSNFVNKFSIFRMAKKLF
jgi:hypothetical protein